MVVGSLFIDYSTRLRLHVELRGTSNLSRARKLGTLADPRLVVLLASDHRYCDRMGLGLLFQYSGTTVPL